eukprot:3475480-Rhodomonas_salina.1
MLLDLAVRQPVHKPARRRLEVKVGQVLLEPAGLEVEEVSGIHVEKDHHRLRVWQKLEHLRGPAVRVVGAEDAPQDAERRRIGEASGDVHDDVRKVCEKRQHLLLRVPRAQKICVLPFLAECERALLRRLVGGPRELVSVVGAGEELEGHSAALADADAREATVVLHEPAQLIAQTEVCLCLFRRGRRGSLGGCAADQLEAAERVFQVASFAHPQELLVEKLLHRADRQQQVALIGSGIELHFHRIFLGVRNVVPQEPSCVAIGTVDVDVQKGRSSVRPRFRQSLFAHDLQYKLLHPLRAEFRSQQLLGQRRKFSQRRCDGIDEPSRKGVMRRQIIARERLDK